MSKVTLHFSVLKHLTTGKYFKMSKTDFSEKQEDYLTSNVNEAARFYGPSLEKIFEWEKDRKNMDFWPKHDNVIHQIFVHGAICDETEEVEQITNEQAEEMIKKIRGV